MSENLIIFNARIVTPTGTSARKGAEMGQLRIIENGTVEVTKGVITYVGESRGEDRDGYYQHYWHYNARGHCLLPGFVDSHTHFVFGGERSEEFSWRLKGESYPANEFPETSLGSRRLSEEDECYGSHHGRR
jgi:imidazolonepropionase